MTDKLSEFRGNLDEIDADLVSTLEKRFGVCKKIGEYKKANNFPVECLDREKQVVESMKENSSLNPSFIEEVFSSIFKESKRIMGEDED